MKIAIQGHSKRGKEVIQILESLGGKSREELTGRRISQYYFINCNGDIDLNLKINLLNHKLYTLEEFEKEFPFKIGEVVFTTVHSTTFKGVVKNINFNDTIYPYNCSFEDSGKCSLGGMNVLVKCETNQLFKMKEERNITLTLDKAKEWYKKGGELREIALQAFTEKELNPLPRSWEEFSYKYKVSDMRYAMPFKYAALWKLEQLRNCWWGDWKPEYNCGTKYIIKWDKDDLIVCTSGRIRAFLIFPTTEMAEAFLKYFRDLIEKAGDLI